jgi:hypothetical protein
MRITAALVLLTLPWSDSATAQEWAPFTTVQDGFTINFPGQPRVMQTTWRSQLDFVLPARVYSADRGSERYSITVVDYSGIEQLGVHGSTFGVRARVNVKRELARSNFEPNLNTNRAQRTQKSERHPRSQ